MGNRSGEGLWPPPLGEGAGGIGIRGAGSLGEEEPRDGPAPQTKKVQAGCLPALRRDRGGMHFSCQNHCLLPWRPPPSPPREIEFKWKMLGVCVWGGGFDPSFGRGEEE